MSTYHKINSLFKRDTSKKPHKLIIGEWASPEFDYLQNNLWDWYEKIDGTNIRIYIDGTSVEIKGRTDNADIPKPLMEYLSDLINYDDLVDCSDIDSKTDSKPLYKNMVLYGEGCGWKIQKAGPLYSKEPKFILFDVNVNGLFLSRAVVEEVAEWFRIDCVRKIGTGTIHEAIEHVKNIPMNDKLGVPEMEGLVIHPEVPLNDRRGNRIIAKVKKVDF